MQYGLNFNDELFEECNTQHHNVGTNQFLYFLLQVWLQKAEGQAEAFQTNAPDLESIQDLYQRHQVDIFV